MMPEWIKDVLEKARETAHLCYLSQRAEIQHTHLKDVLEKARETAHLRYLSQRVEIQHTHLYGFTNVTWITCGQTA